MVTSTSVGRFCFTLLGFLMISNLALAEDEGESKGEETFNYDDEIAVGDLSYDAEVEGTRNVDVDPSAEAEVGGDPAPLAEPEPIEEVDPVYGGESADRESLKPWDWGGPRHHSNLRGPTGLFHIVEAGSDDPGTFGVGIHGAFFRYSDFLFYGDKNDYTWGGAKLRVTVLNFLELFAGLESSSNYNSEVNPKLFQTLGDLLIGAKTFHTPYDWFSIGGLFALNLMNPLGKIDVSFEGLSFDLAVMATLDFYELNPNVPLRLHINAGYLFDRSANLIEDAERKRGGCGSDSDGDGVYDFEGCLNPVERFALGIDRNDQVRLGIGLDALLPYVSPLAEYFIEIPINRQDFVCPLNIPGSPDSCMITEGVYGVRQWVTLGVRILPPIDSLAIDLGVDIGLTGYAPTVHELAPQAPYRVIFGMTYNFDPFAETATVPPPAPPAPVEPVALETVVAGYVHDANDPDKAVSGAVITYVDRTLNPQVSRADGQFVSYPLETQQVSLEVSAEGYTSATFAADLTDSKALLSNPYSPDQNSESPSVLVVKLDCPLVPESKVAVLSVTVTSPDGTPIPDVRVVLDGPTKYEMKTGADGSFEKEIDPGTYVILFEKEGYLKKQKNIVAALDTRSTVEVQLSPKPKTANVIIKKRIIKITKKIHFEFGSAEIKPDSFSLLDEIADVLISHPELKLIEIQGHTDNKGKLGFNMDLSERRAESVSQYITDSGVDKARLEIQGFGPRKPIAPNITKRGRARNRRVEFHIKARDTK